MVIYGDSRAGMWGAALEGVAAKNGYKLRTFYMNGCPALDLHFMSYETHAPNDDCYQFHESAIAAIRNLHPDLVITTSFSTQMLADGSQPTAAEWQQGWASTSGDSPTRNTVGDVRRHSRVGERRRALPGWPRHGSPGVQCADRRSHVEKSRCRASRRIRSGSAVHPHPAVGVCGSLRTVIANMRVYGNRFHFTKSYAVYLTGAVGEALQSTLAWR